MKKTFRNYDKKIIITKKSIVLKEYHQAIFEEGSFDINDYDSNEVGSKKSEAELDELRIKAKEIYYKNRVQEIVEIVECNQFYSFMTITFEQELDEEETKYQFKLAKQRLIRQFGNFKYIAKIEKGTENKRLHLHLIVDYRFLDNNSKFYYLDAEGNKTTKEKSFSRVRNNNWDRRRIIQLIKDTKNKELRKIRRSMFVNGASFLKVVMAVGHIDIESISNIKKAVNYISEYIGKDILSEDMKDRSKKRNLWTSRNLEKAVKITDENVQDYLFDDIMRILLDKTEKLEEKLTKKGEKKYFYKNVDTFSNEFMTYTKIYGDFKDIYYQIKEINLTKENVNRNKWFKNDFIYNINIEPSIFFRKLMVYRLKVQHIIEQYELIDSLGHVEYQKYKDRAKEKKEISRKKVNFLYDMKNFNNVKSLNYVDFVEKEKFHFENKYSLQDFKKII